MQTDILPRQDSKLVQWLDNFATEAGENSAPLGLSEEQVLALQELSEEFEDAMRALETSRQMALAATAHKNEIRRRAEEVFRNTARVVSANKEIEPEFKAKLGLRVEDQPSGPVRIPSGLSVSMQVEGINTLRWDRNGNSRSTSFVVEADSNDGRGWQVVGVCTRLSFVHTGQVVGKIVTYRVYATRAGAKSMPSMAVMAYGPGGPSLATARAA